MEQLKLNKINRVEGSLYLPGSKSISNRILLLSALAQGNIIIKNLLNSNDVSRMLEVLQKMGIQIKNLGKNTFALSGNAGPLPSGNYDLYLENAGTAVRSLTAALNASNGEYIVRGNERMNNRPIIDLIDALKKWDVDIEYIGENKASPPLRITANGLKGGNTSVKGDVSSQYITALLFIAPYAQENSEIKIIGELTSIPYIDMSISLMKTFGVDVVNNNYKSFSIKGKQIYKNPKEFLIESDASSASYFLAAAAINGEVIIEGYGKNSLQGESNFSNVLEKMGADVQWNNNSVKVRSTGTLNAIDIDMNSMTDTGITLAILAVFAKGKTCIRNIANWQVKECARITVVAENLRKIGASVEEGDDYIYIEAPKKFKVAKIDTYDDHRIAMAFSLLSFAIDGIIINDPKCTNKTLPNFFTLLNSISKK